MASLAASRAVAWSRDIVGLDVLMGNVVVMEIFQAGGHVAEELQKVVLVEASHHRGCRAVLAVGHNKIRGAFADVEPLGMEEVRVGHVVDHSELPLEFSDAGRTRPESVGLVNLYCHRHIAGFGVDRFPYFGRSAPANQLHQQVTSIKQLVFR